MIEVRCAAGGCTNIVYTYPSRQKEGRGKYCSRSCSDKITLIKKGQQLSPATQIKKGQKPWNATGWRWSRSHGGTCPVKLIHVPSHPNASKSGYVREHRLIMESHLGRYLQKNEIVKHIDGNATNNSIDNLKLALSNAAYDTRPKSVPANCIPLPGGRYTRVDSDLYHELAAYKWYVIGNRYAAKDEWHGSKKKVVFMHRLIAGTPKRFHTDHINGDTFDNRRSNLRVATHSQNMANCGPRARNTSGYKGVYWSNPARKWYSRIQCNNQDYYLGLFTDEIAAARAYNEKAKELFGEFAYQNEVADG